MSALVDDYFHLTPRPESPNNEGARGGVGGAREPRLHVCQGDCLPVFASSSSHTHLARSGMAKLGIPTPPPSATSIRISFSLCFSFILFFLSSNGENEGDGEYHYRSYESLSYPNPMRHFTRRTVPHYDYDFRWPNPHSGYRCGYYGARWDQAFFFVIVSSESPPSVRHPRPVYVYVPRPPHTPLRIPSSRAPLTSFFFHLFLLLRCFLMPFHFVFPLRRIFSSPPPLRIRLAPPRRVRVTQTVYISLINLPFSSSHLSVFLSATNRPHKQKQPMIHVFLFAIHRNDLACST